MTDTEINIAIAEACGFKKEVGCTGIIRWRNGGELFDKLKDYANDLNAMHEAIAFLNPEEANWFAVELSAIVLENPLKVWWDMNSNEVAHIANATARQRAEAFLRTIGKWEEEVADD